VRLFAPILSFTAEEVWSHLAGDRQDSEDSVLLHIWHEFPLQHDEGALMQRWARIRDLRSRVQGRLEDSRGQGKIGSSLAAEVEIHADGDDFALLDSLGDDMRLIFVTSAARVVRVETAKREGIFVTPCVHPKCERCWHYRGDVGIDADHPTICGRCVSNLYGAGEIRHYA
jgi:isoleucyl-tRNA synthetase